MCKYVLYLDSFNPKSYIVELNKTTLVISFCKEDAKQYTAKQIDEAINKYQNSVTVNLLIEMV